MSKSDKAISIRNLSKAYTIAHDEEKHITLAETLLARLKNPLRRPRKETFWALRDVSFEVKKGDVIGIIGRNGAGKSTLLKILSRITEPTSGEIDVYGRIGSLLEVGTGFHPELTGRENVFLNGAILGMTKSEIRSQFDAIVDFAGVEKFLDTPVKRYSSGMYVRLAFAVAAHLNPEILIVDEVLAVGDAEFQRKCLGKMKDVASTGRTVLFVSHNISAIRALCTSAMLLKAGQMIVHGSVEGVLERYTTREEIDRSHGIQYESSIPGLGLRDVYFVDLENGKRTDTLSFAQSYELRLEVQPALAPLPGAGVVTIFDSEGVKVSMLVTVEEGLDFFDLSKVSVIRFSVPDVALTPGSYRIAVNLCDRYTLFLKADAAADFTIEPRQLGEAPWPYTRAHGFVRTSRGATVESLPATVSA